MVSNYNKLSLLTTRSLTSRFKRWEGRKLFVSVRSSYSFLQKNTNNERIILWFYGYLLISYNLCIDIFNQLYLITLTCLSKASPTTPAKSNWGWISIFVTCNKKINYNFCVVVWMRLLTEMKILIKRIPATCHPVF